jgi:hypothetical protein
MSKLSVPSPPCAPSDDTCVLSDGTRGVGVTVCVLPVRRMEPKKRNRDRQWRNRSKVSESLSRDFPWEVVLRFLKGHPRSLILLQMVDRNLRHLITTDHRLWSDIFTREIKSHAYCVKSIHDPLYPGLKLWKSTLTSLPVYSGPLRGDHDDASLPVGFDASFSSYVRRVYALKHGTRCGMCGCRYRHEPYWSLRMRVCRLCMEGNTISGALLCRKYSVDYSDIVVQFKKCFFFYSAGTLNKDDRVSYHGMTKMDLNSYNYIFWLPHLRKFLDLPSLYQGQLARQRAGIALSNAVKRRWVLAQQHLFVTLKANYSINCLVSALHRNEKLRAERPYGLRGFPGGPEWAFSERPCSGVCKVTARNKVFNSSYFRIISEMEDTVVL